MFSLQIVNVTIETSAKLSKNTTLSRFHQNMNLIAQTVDDIYLNVLTGR